MSLISLLNEMRDKEEMQHNKENMFKVVRKLSLREIKSSVIIGKIAHGPCC